MFPSYGYMDSYPHTSPAHRDNIPYSYHHYPGWEAVSSQARVDQQRPHSFVPWPINGVTHPNPTDCNSFCSHSYPPVYYDSRHPYVHIPPPPHVYYNGQHPPYYYGSYPSFTTPPHYPTDQNMYSYDGVNNHCCGCPNHSSNKGHNDSVKIQEQKSEDDQNNDASGLIRLPNYPYPLECIPPNNSKGKFPAVWNGWAPPDFSSLKWDGNGKKDMQTNERRNQFRWPIVWMPSDKKFEDAMKDLKEVNEKHDEDGKKSLQTIERRNPFPWPSIWMPSDQKSEDAAKELKEVEPERDDGRGSLQANERRNQFPWQIVWMPSDEKPEEPAKDLKEISANPKAEEEFPSRLKIIPLKLLEDESLGRQPSNVDDKHKTSTHPQTVVEDERRIKTIPVKYIEEDYQKKLRTDEKHVVKEKDKSLSAAEKKMENGGNEAPDNKQVSQTKTSKLPPVCLRVDPLPKKKTRSGISRSPSPPSLKDREKASKDKPEKEQAIVKENMTPKKEILVSDVNREVQDKTEKSKNTSQDMMSTENAAELVDIKQSNEGEKKNSMKVNATKPCENGKRIHEEDGKHQTVNVPSELDEGKKHLENKENISSDEKKERNFLSESDAATLIQSAYRGFRVRRWRPLENLRKIGQIRQKSELLKKQIEEFDVSIDQNSKQKTVLSESIMNLLLQLDTIQGLNQSLRDMRKAVARELVSLQEKFDSVGATNITEPELKFEQCASTDYGSVANPAAVSSESASMDSQHETCQTIEVDRKEATIVQQKDVEVSIADSSDSAPGLDDVKSAALEKPISSDEHEIEHSREQLCPSRSELVESSSIGEQVLEVVLEEVKPLASASPEIFEAPAISEDIVTELEKDKHHLESQETNAFAEQVGNEQCVTVAGSDAKDVVELAKLSMVTVEHEATEPLESSASDKVGAMSKELLVQSQSGDLDEKIVAEAYAVHVENPCSDEATLGTCDSGDHVRSMETDDDCTNISLPVTTDASHAETNATPVPDSENIMKDEGHQLESISDKVDGAAVEEANGSPLLSAPVDSSVPAVDNSHSLKEAPEPCQADVTDSNPPVDAVVNVKEDECIVADETYETTVNGLDGAAAEEGKGHIAPAEDTPPPISMAESVVSIEKRHVAHSDDNAEFYSSGINLSKQEMKFVEENEKLREMLERLLEAGKAQMGVIADLNGRVKDLEKKLSQDKRRKVRSYKPRRITSHRDVS